MKNVLILFALLFSVSAFSQEVTLKAPMKKSRSGFKIDKDLHSTTESIEIEGKEFSIYKTSKGSPYIISIGTKGTEYPVWIGIEHETLTYKGEPIRLSSSGKMVELYLKSNGYPHRRYHEINLPTEEGN